jgi:Putative amidase domain
MTVASDEYPRLLLSVANGAVHVRRTTFRVTHQKPQAGTPQSIVGQPISGTRRGAPATPVGSPSSSSPGGRASRTPPTPPEPSPSSPPDSPPTRSACFWHTDKEQVHLGDIVFHNWNDKGDDHPNGFNGIRHASVGTRIDSHGDIYISRHRPNRKNYPLTSQRKQHPNTHAWIVTPFPRYE